MTSRSLSLTLAGDLAVSYPGRNVTEAHAQSWAAEFQGEAEDVARSAALMLRQRSIDPPSVAQVRQAIREASQHTMSGPFRDLGYDGPVRGEPLAPEVLRHGMYHLHRYLAGGHDDERPGMIEPWNCECGKERSA